MGYLDGVAVFTRRRHAGGQSIDRSLEVLVISHADAAWGAEVFLLGTALPLAERGVNLTLACDGESPLAHAWSATGLPLVPMSFQRHVGLRRADGSDRRPSPVTLLTQAVAIGKSVFAIRKIASRYDVVHSYSMRAHIESTLGARLARRPVVLDLVNIVRPGIGRRVLRGTARLATLTVANSSATAAVLGEKPRVTVINPGIDLDRFVPGTADPALRAELGGAGRHLVGIVGRVDPRKGVQIVVEAMAHAAGAAANAALVVVGGTGTGPPEFFDEVKAKATALLGDRVRFVGKRTDIPDVLRCLDVLVNASVAEPFGLSALEAQACGVPVIGTASGGLVEFVEHEVTGLLVPPFDPIALAAALDRMLVDADLRARCVEAAQDRARPARGLAVQYDLLASMYRAVGERSPDRLNLV